MVYHTNSNETKPMATTKPPVKKATTISMDGSLLAAARREAKKQRRTLSAQLENWIEEALIVKEAKSAR